MFDLIYALVGGQHRELARRRDFAEPRLDDAGTMFVAPDEPQHTGWLGRGEVPGARAIAPPDIVDPLDADDVQTLVDEMRAYAQTPRR
jgi:hypothetical protein